MPSQLINAAKLELKYTAPLVVTSEAPLISFEAFIDPVVIDEPDIEPLTYNEDPDIEPPLIELPDTDPPDIEPLTDNEPPVIEPLLTFNEEPVIAPTEKAPETVRAAAVSVVPLNVRLFEPANEPLKLYCTCPLEPAAVTGVLMLNRMPVAPPSQETTVL